MILLQTPWTPATADRDLSGVIQQALSTLVDPTGALVLLPHADGAPAKAGSDADAISAVKALAKKHGISLCGSACVRA